MVCPSQSLLKSSSSYAGYDGRNSDGSGALIETKDLYFSHPRECSIYIGCDEFGNMSVLECLNGTHFSPYYQSCVHASIAQCKKYATIDQTPINISLRLLIMNNSLRNFDLELFNNSNETILEESYLGGNENNEDDTSSSSVSPSAAGLMASDDKSDDQSSYFIETRALNTNQTLITSSNLTNSTQL